LKGQSKNPILETNVTLKETPKDLEPVEGSIHPPKSGFSNISTVEAGGDEGHTLNIEFEPSQ